MAITIANNKNNTINPLGPAGGKVAGRKKMVASVEQLQTCTSLLRWCDNIFGLSTYQKDWKKSDLGHTE